MDLAAEVYRVTASWLTEEASGLTSQARRAAVFVPANIAEGYGRQSKASYGQFLKIARGSLKGLETHDRVNIAAEGDCAELLKIADEVGKVLGGLIRSVGHSSQTK